MLLKEKRKEEGVDEKEFRLLVRKIYKASKVKQTLVVVNKIHPSDVLFRHFHPSMDIQIQRGLIEIKTYDSLTVNDLEKDREIFEL